MFIGLWYLMHYWALEALWDKPSFLITAPHRVVQDSYLEADPARADAATGSRWTAFVALTGLSISIVLGMSLAIVMAQATWVERSFWPYLIAAQAVPILAIVPIIGTIFGYGFSSRILVCVIISIFPIVSNTLFGLLSAERSQHDLFTLHDASRRTRLAQAAAPGRAAGDLHRVPHRRRPVGDRRRRRRAVLPPRQQGHRDPDGPVPLAQPATR